MKEKILNDPCAHSAVALPSRRWPDNETEKAKQIIPECPPENGIKYSVKFHVIIRSFNQPKCRLISLIRLIPFRPLNTTKKTSSGDDKLGYLILNPVIKRAISEESWRILENPKESGRKEDISDGEIYLFAPRCYFMAGSSRKWSAETAINKSDK